MVNVLLVCSSDSKGQTRFLLADPIGKTQAGEYVTAELMDGGSFTILLHGQREFDIPGRIKAVSFPDGSTWTPKRR